MKQNEKQKEPKWAAEQRKLDVYNCLKSVKNPSEQTLAKISTLEVEVAPTLARLEKRAGVERKNEAKRLVAAKKAVGNFK